MTVLLLVLAIGLLVLGTRDARGLLGHRAWILGMARGGQHASELLGLLRAVLVVASAGATLGNVLPRLVGSAIDLASLTGAVPGAGTASQPLVPVGVGLALLLLALGFLVLDRAVLTRRPLQATLREGKVS